MAVCIALAPSLSAQGTTNLALRFLWEDRLPVTGQLVIETSKSGIGWALISSIGLVDGWAKTRLMPLPSAFYRLTIEESGGHKLHFFFHGMLMQLPRLKAVNGVVFFYRDSFRIKRTRIRLAYDFNFSPTGWPDE